ncbi:Cl- channel voltage-gated family protein [Stanieria cyanosphaera PCC 7437]|uniref:Cl-channel voltage-gated family protein n=1 Tax=Stanieria cyanosphaera (strain ATCC 29371 / PCC 7437) TaxID=111780 RepID=K9XRI3_STAC7|nr:chloride channel protein [Stanieria cyanosphaera]AFZ35225.1 Cl- channel voltage-gated family protein [Stanieria cyanosphaera PCC 7437]
MANDKLLSLLTSVGGWTIGGLLGGLVGSLAAVLLTESIKRSLDAVSRLDTVWLLLLPLLGVTLAVLVLHGLGKGKAVQVLVSPKAALPLRRLPPPTWYSFPHDVMRRLPPPTWYSFPHDVARADLSADVVATAGAEERFPWNLAPLRALAILSTVGLGATMGTESPAAHIGVATGVWLGSTNPALRRLVRPMAVGGGAAGVAALMGIPLVGSFFMFELSQRRKVPIAPKRVAAMLAGGLVGWGVNVAFRLDLIRLVVPKVSPADFWDGVAAALFIGALAGAITALTGEAIYWARGLPTKPVIRLLIGGMVMLSLAMVIGLIATPTAAFGPGGAAIIWAETVQTSPYQLLAVALLRAASTTAAVVAGGCGGVFVPFLAIGDLSGRVFATAFGIPADLAGAAGAAAGITGGYRLPFTAVAMVLGIGGPSTAKLTCLATVVVAALSGLVTTRAVNTLSSSLFTTLRRKRSSAD